MACRIQSVFSATNFSLEWVFFADRMKQLVIPFFILICAYAKGQQTVGVFYNLPQSFNGYTLIAGSGSDTVYLIDNCGYQVHKWVTQGPPGLVTYLLSNGDILRSGKINSSIFSGGGSGGLVQKYNWDSELIWSYQVSDSLVHQHHDVEPMPNGNVLVLSWGRISNSQAIIMGRDPSTLNGDLWPTLVQELEPVYPDQANVVWQWSIQDHFIQDLDPTKLNYGVVADHPELLDINYSTNGSADFLHCNAVNYHAAHDLIVLSSRKSSEIYVIDHSTTTAEAASHSGGSRGKGGDFLYRWGNPQIYDRGVADDQILWGPHDIHWIPDSLPDGDKFMVFNNGGGSPGSSVEVFDGQMDANGDFPNPGSGSHGPATTDWHFEEVGFSSNTISGAQRLPNGNTLVCEGSPGRLFELDQNDNMVWEYVSPSSASNNITQGANPIQNAMFRAYRYPPDFPAFIGKDLTPGNLIEVDSNPAPCSIFSDPSDTTLTVIITKSPQLIVPSRITDLLKIENEGDEMNLTVFNLLGQPFTQLTVRSGTNLINTSSWPNGLYIVLVKDNSGRTFTGKTVKQ